MVKTRIVIPWQTPNASNTKKGTPLKHQTNQEQKAASKKTRLRKQLIHNQRKKQPTFSRAGRHHATHARHFKAGGATQVSGTKTFAEALGRAAVEARLGGEVGGRRGTTVEGGPGTGRRES